jgi:hypothetical protein
VDAGWFLIGAVSGMMVMCAWLLHIARGVVQKLKDQHDKDIDKARKESYHNGLERARTDPNMVRGNYNAMFGDLVEERKHLDDLDMASKIIAGLVYQMGFNEPGSPYRRD